MDDISEQLGAETLSKPKLLKTREAHVGPITPSTLQKTDLTVLMGGKEKAKQAPADAGIEKPVSWHEAHEHEVLHGAAEGPKLTSADHLSEIPLVRYTFEKFIQLIEFPSDQARELLDVVVEMSNRLQEVQSDEAWRKYLGEKSAYGQVADLCEAQYQNRLRYYAGLGDGAAPRALEFVQATLTYGVIPEWYQREKNMSQEPPKSDKPKLEIVSS